MSTSQKQPWQQENTLKLIKNKHQEIKLRLAAISLESAAKELDNLLSLY